MIENTIEWYNGEIFEARLIAAFGVLAIASGLLLYFFTDAPSSKALLIPLAVVGVVFAVIGWSMDWSNNRNLANVETVYAEDRTGFLESERQRVEKFQYLYTMSIGISLACFLSAVGLLYFATNIHLQALGIALIVFGSAFAVIDYFSKERSVSYYQSLNSFHNP